MAAYMPNSPFFSALLNCKLDVNCKMHNNIIDSWQYLPNIRITRGRKRLVDILPSGM